MSEENTIRARLLPDGTVVEVLPDGSTRPMESDSDWTRFDAMTEEEIEANALSDPDNPPLTDEELSRMRPVPNPARIREALNMTQLEFAETFEISLETVQEWEQSFPVLNYTVKTLLRVIEQDPEMVKAALEKSYQKTY